jgi:hypothetical protein
MGLVPAFATLLTMNKKNKFGMSDKKHLAHMIPMSTTTRAMLNPEAEKVDERTDAVGLY